MQANRHEKKQNLPNPLDQLINLIAKVEVEKYLQEVKDKMAEQKNDSSNIRAI